MRFPILFFCLLALGEAVHAGPPFLTDDPEPVPYRHYEAYLYTARDGTRAGSAYAGPGSEANWGAVPDVQLHIAFGTTVISPAGDVRAYGIGDLELGVKYRVIHETKWRPEFSLYPMIELPTGSAAAGLGNGRSWYRLPVWAQKSIGPWTTYGGGGEVLNSAPGLRNYTFAGWLVQREVGKKLTLGMEAYRHGAEGMEALSTRASTLIDAGGYYHFRKPGFQLLFMVGHSVAGQPEAVGYLGLYWTWGKDAVAKSSGLLHERAGL
jgi:hypothetical protein